MHEAEIRLKDSGIKRLLRPSAPTLTSTTENVQSTTEPTISNQPIQDEDDGDNGSLKGDSDDETEVRQPSPPPVQPKAPVRRMGKK